MATKFAIPSNGPEDWARVLGDPVKHWRTGYSARSAAYSWETARGLPVEIAEALGPDVELLLAIPEHKVEMPGRGADSQCDVFALCRRSGELMVVAVEAKVDESFGPTIGDWLAEGGQNRRDRIDRLVADLSSPADPTPDLRYQLFHRTAAAVYEARRFGAREAVMLVQSFSGAHRWREDFDAFVSYLGAAPDGPLSAYTLPDGLELRLGWVTSSFPIVPDEPAPAVGN